MNPHRLTRVQAFKLRKFFNMQQISTENSMKIQQKKQQSQQQNKKCKKTPYLIYRFLKHDDELEQASRLFTKSFVNMNKMWKKMGAKYEEVLTVNRGRMISCSKAGWTCAMVNNQTNKMIAVILFMDLLDYVGAETMPNNSPFFKKLGHYAQILEKDYFQQLKPTLKRGHSIYNYGGAVEMQYAKSYVSKQFWAMGLSHLKCAGYKACYMRATNRVSAKILIEFGTKVVRKLDITQQGLEGQYMELMRIDLDNLAFDSLSKFFEDKNPIDDQQF